MQPQTLDRRDTDTHARPKPAKLYNATRDVVRVFLYLALALVTLPLTLFAVSPQAGVMGELFGAILGLSMLLAALITALVGLSISRRLRRFQQGDYLVHWTYTPDEWLAFADSEYQRRLKGARLAPVFGLVSGALLGLVFGGMVGHIFSRGDVAATVLGVLAGGGLLGLLGALVGWACGSLSRLIGRRNYQWMRQRDGETYIGLNAVYCEGFYWTWSMPNTRLVGVAVVEGSPTVLEFTVSVYMPKGGTALYKHRAPVPQGREGEALWVIERLSGR